MNSDVRPANGFLAALPAADFDLIRPYLRTVQLRQSNELVRAGQRFKQVYMPHEGIIALNIRLGAGKRVEIAMIGRDSILGALAIVGDPVSLGEASVLLPGAASVVDSMHLREACNQSEGLRDILGRHVQAVFVQAQQSAACNASHLVENRLARCLLRTFDLCGSDTFYLTQETMAQMIGAGRNSVSLVAHTLQEAGLIHYSRGQIRLLDLTGLKKNSCECYNTVKIQHERLLK